MVPGRTKFTVFWNMTARRSFTLWILPALCTLTAFPFLLHSCDWDTKKDTVIVVGSRRVTADQLRKDIDFITAGMGSADLTPLPIQGELLEQIIDHYLMLEFAREQGISITDKELEATLKEIRSDYGNGDFREALLRGYTDAAEWQHRLREQLLVQKVLRTVTDAVPPPSYDEIKEYYDSHQDQYATPQMLRFRQIVTRTEDEARDLLAKIQAGEDMGELARKHSVGPEADRDGDVGWVARGQLEESMEEAVFSLPEGKISGIVESPYGYHIFEVTATRPEGARELPEVVQEIETTLLSEKREAFCKTWLEELRDRIPVTVNKNLLEQM